MFQMDKGKFRDELITLIASAAINGEKISNDSRMESAYNLCSEIEAQIIETLFIWNKEFDFDVEIIDQIIEEARIASQVNSIVFASSTNGVLDACIIFPLSYIIFLKLIKQELDICKTLSDKKDMLAKFIIAYENTTQEKSNELLLYLRGYVKYLSEKHNEIEEC
jgi:hypothetical protein